uniref:Putative Thiosulfate sulfurtransferase n=1 Tax=Magnetococcus massalia (strain MO-1) TaxID=451514 RepID=A0A1S7LJ89_MAGMO|nr:putative Thiosulfate sulfurtransferase [Candidatus Magnetococcus massalia]
MFKAVKGSSWLKVVSLSAMLLCSSSVAMANEEQEITMDRMNDYMSEATHVQGMVTPEQVATTYLGVAAIFDTREEEQYEESHIKGAKHMEWREVIDRLDEIPTDKPVVLYCGTGALAAQAGFALRVLGRTNVVILRGGYEDWVKYKKK